jgi:septal ring factor EnvC (AmiA/AmiB activator)
MTSFGNPGNRKGPSLRDLMRNNGGANAVPPARTPPPPPPEEDPWGDPPAKDNFHAAAPEDTLGSRDDFGQTGSSEVDHLLAENEELRNQNAEFIEAIENLRSQLESSSGQGGDDERTSLLDQMLEEKSETIRTLHVRIKELEQIVDETGGGGGGPPMPAADREELAAMMDEIERERCQLEQERSTLDDDRRQLREDEEAMMRQMREMELQMAKERAELARQRNELQRLHAEIRHELELAQRDAAVNERLRMLQRRHQEVEEPGAAEKPGSRPAKPASGNSGVRPVPQKPGQAPTKPSQAPPGNSSIFKRFLGGDK